MIQMDNLSLEDVLPDTLSTSQLSGAATAEIFSSDIEINGKKYSKSSLVAGLGSDRLKKVTIRTLRVQGWIPLEDIRQKSKFEDLVSDSLDGGKWKNADFG